MSKLPDDDPRDDVAQSRRFDPQRGSFDPPEHPSLKDPDSNPRGVRHINETAQDHMAVTDRPRFQAAQSRRASMIEATKRRLRILTGNGAKQVEAPAMHTAPMPRHPDDVELDWNQVVDALGALEGAHVTVRVVERSEPELLIAVTQGTLGAASEAKHPACFWSVRLTDGQPPAQAPGPEMHVQRDADHLEDVGFYLRPERFEGAVARAGSTVLAIIQGPVLINVRRT